MGHNSFDKEPYHPLFFLAEPPDKYLDSLESHSDQNTAWLAISSSAPSPSQILSEIKSHISELPSQPMPFLNYTVSEVYSFWNSHLRGPADSKGHHHFTDFTFLAVDSECFGSSPSSYTIFLCSDAPDFEESETEVRLKIIRLPLVDALASLELVEQLLLTPSEAQIAPPDDSDLDLTTVKVVPNPKFIPVEPYTNDEDQEYRIAAPAEARMRKREGLMAAVPEGWELGKGFPDGKPINSP